MDAELAALISSEAYRQRSTITLTASENYPSITARQALSSIFCMKLSLEYPGSLAAPGCEFAQGVERIAKERAESLFDAGHANVRCTSGAQANFAVYLAALRFGDIVLAPPLSLVDSSQGGEGNISAHAYRFVRYEIDDATGEVDYDDVRQKAHRYKPQLIMIGASNYPRILDIPRFRSISDEVGALLHVDAAHIAGLVAGKVHPQVFPLADYMTCSTHKTLRGPRGGALVLCRADNAERLDKAVSPGIQSAPVVSGIAACAVILGEALREEFRIYQQRVVRNARLLAEALESSGLTLAFGGTETHMVVIDLRQCGLSGEQAMELLSRVGIMSTAARLSRDVPTDGGSSGLRLGTAAVTTRGMDRSEMENLARIIAGMLTAGDRVIEWESLRRDVEEIAEGFPLEPQPAETVA